MENEVTLIPTTDDIAPPTLHERKPSARPSAGPRRPRGKTRAAVPHAGETAAEAPRKAAPRSAAFAELGLSEALLDALARAGFETPTDIQRELIPPALAGKDCLGQARTGTGKTAAFTLPLLQRVRIGGGVQALVLVPTRELAAQVGEHVQLLSPERPPRCAVIFGGTRIASNLRDLRGPIDLVVGTPGRVIDMIQRGALDLSTVRIAVLDEVDRMLDIGFRDDIRKVMAATPSNRQTIFVSATVTDEIRGLARGLMRHPVEINVSGDNLSVDAIEQHYLTVEPSGKFDALREHFRTASPSLAIVFARTQRGAANVARRLNRANIPCAEIHGGLAQSRRTRVLSDLRAGKLKVLVATDLAARGIDVSGISHIINYDIPEDPAIYVHRIGRTARMGERGHALTFVTREQGAELTAIEKLINRELRPMQPRRPAKPDHGDAATTHAASHKPAHHAKQGPHSGSHADAAVSAAPAEPQLTRPPRTLGSRFPSRRRRR